MQIVCTCRNAHSSDIPAQRRPEEHRLGGGVADHRPPLRGHGLWCLTPEIVKNPGVPSAQPVRIGEAGLWTSGAYHHVLTIRIDLICKMFGYHGPVRLGIIADPSLYSAGHFCDNHIVAAFDQPRPIRLPEPAIRAQQALTENAGPLRALRSLITHQIGGRVWTGPGVTPPEAHNRRTSRAQASVWL